MTSRFRLPLLATGMLALAACQPQPAYGPYGQPAPQVGTGTAVGAVGGAVAGGLIGNAVAGRGNRTAGTLIGAGVGAVAGGVVGTAVENQQRQQVAPQPYYAPPPK
jgi:hypothetical protein